MKNLFRSKGGHANVYKSLHGGRGGPKSPKTRLRSLWMAPYVEVLKMFDTSMKIFFFRESSANY